MDWSDLPILLVIAISLVGFCLMVAGFVMSRQSGWKQKKWTLTGLLVIVAVVGIFVGWVGRRMHQARKQQAAADAIVNLGGEVVYDSQKYQGGGWSERAEPSGPAWLRNLLGDDFFSDVVFVLMQDAQFNDDLMLHLADLPNLRALDLSDTQMADAELEHLKELTNLEGLDLSETQVTDAGLEHLAGLANLRRLNLHQPHDFVLPLLNVVPPTMVVSPQSH